MKKMFSDKFDFLNVCVHFDARTISAAALTADIKRNDQLKVFVLKTMKIMGGLHSTEVAFAIHSQQPKVRFSAPEYYRL